MSALGSITYFSPVYGSDLPDADLVYLPEDIRNCSPVNCIGAKG